MKTPFGIILLIIPIFGISIAEEANPESGRPLKSGEDQEEINQYFEQARSAKSNEDIVNKVLLPALEKDPNNLAALDTLTLMMLKMQNIDKAKEYIDRSLGIKKTDKSLELFSMVCIARKDIKGLSVHLADLENIKDKSPILIRALLTLSQQNKDNDLYKRTIQYIEDNKVQDAKVLRDQNKVANFFQNGMKPEDGDK